MTGAAIQSSDRTSVLPRADVRAAAAVRPAAAAPLSVVAASLRGALAPCERSSRDLPAASSDVAGLSSRVSIKNVTTFAVAAASETISKSVSTTSIPTT